MRVFIGKSHKRVNLYTIETKEETYATSDRTYTRTSHENVGELRIDHEAREKAVIKYFENARIVSLGKSSKGDFEIEIENGDNLEKLEHMLQVSLVYTEVKDILNGYSEGEIPLDDAYVQLLPYVVAKKLVKP